jgi:hypothetical protein
MHAHIERSLYLSICFAVLLLLTTEIPSRRCLGTFKFNLSAADPYYSSFRVGGERQVLMDRIGKSGLQAAIMGRWFRAQGRLFRPQERPTQVMSNDEGACLILSSRCDQESRHRAIRLWVAGAVYKEVSESHGRPSTIAQARFGGRVTEGYHEAGVNSIVQSL